MIKRKKIYEGKAKILYTGPRPGTLVQYFKDDATAFNNKKKGKISNKGMINNMISESIMMHLKKQGVPTHFIERINDREQVIKKVNIIPLEVVARNIAAGSICKRLGLKEGITLPGSIIEFYLKSDKLDDPHIIEEHILNFRWCTKKELQRIKLLAHKINNHLKRFFAKANLKLVDFKMEFGKSSSKGKILLADEISPDSCRLWDKKTNKKLDKDRFRQNLGNVDQAYKEVYKRLGCGK